MISALNSRSPTLRMVPPSLYYLALHSVAAPICKVRIVGVVGVSSPRLGEMRKRWFPVLLSHYLDS